MPAAAPPRDDSAIAIDLLLGAAVPDAARQRLVQALQAAGIPTGRELGAGERGGHRLLLCLFTGLDPATAARLRPLAGADPSCVFGVLLCRDLSPAAAAAAVDGWTSLGLARERLVLWDGLSPPHLALDWVQARRGEVAARRAGPASPVIEVVLRDGSVLRAPSDLPAATLHRLLGSLDR